MPFFSVVSRLRAQAAHVVYQAAPVLRGNRAVVLAPDGAEYLHLDPGPAWTVGKHTETAFWLLEVTSATPEAAARSLAVRENQVAEYLGDALYTLVLGPETQEGEGPVTRRVPLAVLKGVYALGSSGSIDKVKPATARKFTFGAPSRGR